MILVSLRDSENDNRIVVRVITAPSGTPSLCGILSGRQKKNMNNKGEVAL
jgi:hypothetical protein